MRHVKHKKTSPGPSRPRLLIAGALASALALSPVAASAIAATADLLRRRRRLRQRRVVVLPRRLGPVGRLARRRQRLADRNRAPGLRDRNRIPRHEGAERLHPEAAGDLLHPAFYLTEVPAAGVTLKTWADDGVIAYVNGDEVVRRNMPTGEIKHASYATAAPQTTTARANPATVTVPASALTSARTSSPHRCSRTGALPTTSRSTPN